MAGFLNPRSGNCTGDDCYMAEDRGRIGVEMYSREEGGGKSVKGNPFGPCFLSGGKERQYVFT